MNSEVPLRTKEKKPSQRVTKGMLFFFKILGYYNNFETKRPQNKAKIVYLPFSFFEMRYLLDDFDAKSLEKRITIEEVKKFLAEVYEITRDYSRIRKTLNFFRIVRAIASLVLIVSFVLIFFGVGYYFTQSDALFTENAVFFIGVGLFVFSILFLIILNCFFNRKIQQVFKEYEKRTRIVIRRYNGKYAEKGILFRLSRTEGLSVIEIIATFAYSRKQGSKDSEPLDETESIDLSPYVSPQISPKPDEDSRLESDFSDTKPLA